MGRPVYLAPCCIAQMSPWQWPPPAAAERAALAEESHVAHASTLFPRQPLLDDCLSKEGYKGPTGLTRLQNSLQGWLSLLLRLHCNSTVPPAQSRFLLTPPHRDP